MASLTRGNLRMETFAMVSSVPCVCVCLIFIAAILVDISVYHNGFHGDVNETFFVGNSVDDASRHLVKTAYECMMSGIGIGMWSRKGHLLRWEGHWWLVCEVISSVQYL